MHLQSLSSILSHVTLMNPDDRRKDLSTNNRATKAIGAMPIIGILAAAALLSGFSSIIGSETAIAQQQNMTGTNATAANATAANATAANATGNQTATSSNQTGAAATSGGSNNAGTVGSYYP
jgi:predicted amino acid dehydrogenase